MAVKSDLNVSSKRKAAQAVKFCVKQERNVMLKKVYALLKKTEVDRSEEEKQFLYTYIDLVKEVRRRIERQKTLKDRLKEVEDPPDVIAEKCAVLAGALSSCRRLVVYTGAGVSTAACIPDYRGSNGIWTLLQQGKDIGLHDLSKAEPTLTHMALTQLFHVGLIKHVVSQNCDGLHLRSGLPREALSEVHGNMYVEVCRKCQPVKEYLRLFDVTENTGRFNHRTGRRCYACSGPLVDSIVHFGERGTLKWPLNWPGAVSAAANADAILCIGSSLKVLKRYPWLWGMDKHPKKRPKLYIVNLQWTPKDDQAVLKINARCDFVMEQVMRRLCLNVPVYDRAVDPIFSHATSLHPGEKHTTTKPFLLCPVNKTDDSQSFISQEISSAKYKVPHLSSNKYEKPNLPSSSVKKENLDENKVDCSESLCKNGDEVENVCTFSDSVKEETPFRISCQTDSSVDLKNDSHFTDLLDKSRKLSGDYAEGKICMRNNSFRDKCPVSNKNFSCPKFKIEPCLHEHIQIKQESTDESIESNEPFLEIIYEGVKLKVEDNVSVEANVKINNDVLILCDTPSILGNSFIFNSSYEFEEAGNNFKFINFSTGSNMCDDETESFKESDDSPTKEKFRKSSIHGGIQFHSKQGIYQLFDASEHSCKQFPLIRDCGSFNEMNVLSKHSLSGKAVSLLPLHQEETLCECSCCATWYGTSKCLFYLPVEPAFKDESAGVCECCLDESVEEEEEEEDLDESDKKEEKEESEKREEKDGTINDIKPVTNPGWYGKGYRKRTKKKR